MENQTLTHPTLHWKAFHRFLLIGSEQGVYETPLPDLWDTPTPALERCLDEDGPRAVGLAANWLLTGRPYRPEPALYVIARAATHPDAKTRQEAFEWLPMAVRTSAQLFQLVDYLEPMTTWSRPLRAAIGEWYSRCTAVELVHHVLRSPADRAWNHRLILELAFPKPPTKSHAQVFRWITHGAAGGPMLDDPGLELISAHELLQTTNSEAVVATLLRRWPHLREDVPDAWLKYPSVWRQILPTLSSEALVRWLPRLADANLLHEDSRVTATILQRLQLGGLGRTSSPASALKALGAVRHAAALSAQRPPGALEAALLAMFHDRVRAIRPSGGTLVVAIDPEISTARDGLPGLPGVSPREAIAALTLMAAATAREVHVLSFGKEPTRLDLAPDERIETLLAKLDALPHGPADGASPIHWAMRNDLQADAFLVLSGTRPPRSAGDPEAAFSAYREVTNRRAVWLGVTVGPHRLCAQPPANAYMMEAHGLDASVPPLILDLLGEAPEP